MGQSRHRPNPQERIADFQDHYRSESLLSVIGKCYTFILNKRLYAWLKQNNQIVEEQAGFRKSYSTVDCIFALNVIVQKHLDKRGAKVYVAFAGLLQSIRLSKTL